MPRFTEQAISKHPPIHEHQLCKVPNDWPFFYHRAVNYGNHMAILQKVVFFGNGSYVSAGRDTDAVTVRTVSSSRMLQNVWPGLLITD